MKVLKNLHNSKKMSKNNNSKSYRRIVFDEICANFLTLSENRKRIKKNKIPKKFNNKNIQKNIIKKLPLN